MIEGSLRSCAPSGGLVQSGLEDFTDSLEGGAHHLACRVLQLVPCYKVLWILVGVFHHFRYFIGRFAGGYVTRITAPTGSHFGSGEELNELPSSLFALLGDALADEQVAAAYLCAVGYLARQEADAEIKLGRVHDEGEHARGMVEHGGASRHEIGGVEAQVL